MKLLHFVVLFSLLSSTEATAQDNDFCDAVTTIIKDAPNKFRNIRGNQKAFNASATVWECGIKVPETIGSRFVSSMGLFYEGAFFQSKSKEGLKSTYLKCIGQLDSCLAPLQYKMSMQPNFYPGMDEYRKVVFMPQVDSVSASEKAPPHVTLEATYNKDIKLYTVVMYIFEH